MKRPIFILKKLQKAKPAYQSSFQCQSITKNSEKVDSQPKQAKRSTMLFSLFILYFSYWQLLSYLNISKEFVYLNQVILSYQIEFNYINMAIDTGSTAWVLISGALATLVAPGFGLFFGGMADKKNILSTIAYCILIFSTAVIAWGLLGFSFAYGNSTVARGFIGDCTYCWLRRISVTSQSVYAPNVPFTAFFFYQSVVAGLGAVLSIIGLVGRIRVAFIIVLTVAYILTIHAIVTYWVRNSEGWLNVFGYIDFGGGSYVHIASGFSSLGAIYYLGQGKLKQYKHTSSSIALTLIGTTVLWLGWFGLNGGATTASGQVTAVALTNTQLAACAGAMAWSFSQYIFTESPHILGFCCGVICGLTSITSGAGYVSLWSALVIGAVGGILAYVYSHYKTKHFKEKKDSLDVFGCHGIGGAWGAIAVGMFATLDSGSKYQGLFYGNAKVFGQNLLGVLVIAFYSFFVIWINIFILERLLEMKVPGQQERAGLDKEAHQDEQPLNKLGIIAELKDYQKSLLGIGLIKNQELAVQIKQAQKHQNKHNHHGKQAFQEIGYVSESENSHLAQCRKKQEPQVPQEVIDKLIEQRRAKQTQLINLIERHIKKRDRELKQ